MWEGCLIAQSVLARLEPGRRHCCIWFNDESVCRLDEVADCGCNIFGDDVTGRNDDVLDRSTGEWWG